MKSILAALLFAALLELVSGGASAQQYIRIPTCGTASPPVGASQGYMDANGNICSGTSAPPQTYFAPTFAAVTNATSSIIAAGTYAHFILICTLNSSAAPVYFGVGSTAVIGSGIVISPGGGCVNFGGTNLPMPTSGQAVNAITATGQNVAIQGG